MSNSQIVLHKANERGFADHGWLQTWHTFSFASYYNPQSVHFGVLRVLNDDIVQGAKGFGLHPHDNMEIITVPFSGRLEHADSMGHKQVLSAGEVQVMSAGTGLLHSEYNADAVEAVNLAQIWIFPQQRDVQPRYDQKAFDVEQRKNRLQLLVSPDGNNDSLWINQQAWIYRADIDEGTTLHYSPQRSTNGVYVFVVEGRLSCGTHELSRRDGIGIAGESSIDIEAHTASQILLLDVPMFNA